MHNTFQYNTIEELKYAAAILPVTNKLKYNCISAYYI